MVKSRYLKLFKLCIWKTLYVNFKCLPINKAIKIPIFVFTRTEITSLKGVIQIEGEVKTGMIQFNYINDEFVGGRHWRRIHIDGTVCFTGKIDFGVGALLFVRKTGKITFGHNVIISGLARVLCEERITIGNNVRLTHECQLMDSNFHYIRNVHDGTVAKCTLPVKIGNNNWIGNRSTVMKGTITPDYLIVASNSLLNSDYTHCGSYAVLAGIPAKKISSGFERIFDLKVEDMYNLSFGRTF